MVLVATSVIGLGLFFGVACFYLRSIGNLSTPPDWEVFLATAGGMLMGFGLSLPFFLWFRLQSALAEVEIKLEQHAREANKQAAATTRSIQDLADAGMSGEWRVSSLTRTSDLLNPDKES